MRVATICHDVEFLDEMRLSFHFVLAPKVQDDTAAQRFYRRRSLYGDFIILDNGAAEDELMHYSMLLDVANAIRADEVVLPDVLRDAEKTLALATDKYVLGHFPFRNRLVVPQGKDWDEWQYCLTELVAKASPATIGIPKWLDELPGGRLQALQYIYDRKLFIRHDVHLLGMARPAHVEVRELNYWFVRSIDTALPIALAQLGLHLTYGAERFTYVWGKDFDKQLAAKSIVWLLSEARGGVKRRWQSPLEASNAHLGKRPN